MLHRDLIRVVCAVGLGVTMFVAGYALVTAEDVPAASTMSDVYHVPRDYATIQAAVNAADEGGIIQVSAGVYRESVVITTSGLRLHGSAGVVIEGAGTGVGIFVGSGGLGTPGPPVTDVEISGVEVRGFERGILVNLGSLITIHNNDVHDIRNVGSVTAGDGTGIEFWTTTDSEVTQNFVHENGEGGIYLRLGSTRNTIRGNRVHENGDPLRLPSGGSTRGTGILLTGVGTNHNDVLENEILRNYDRGILIVRPAGPNPATGNLVAQNRIQESQRSGIAIMGSAAGNFVYQNDARGNNLSGLPPCYQCNLNDMSTPGIGGNSWEHNLGTFNLIDDCLVIPTARLITSGRPTPRAFSSR